MRVANPDGIPIAHHEPVWLLIEWPDGIGPELPSQGSMGGARCAAFWNERSRMIGPELPSQGSMGGARCAAFWNERSRTIGPELPSQGSMGVPPGRGALALAARNRCGGVVTELWQVAARRRRRAA